MKSRFFGLSAKLALAALAVGFTFTSCYDSANENVVVPVTPGEVILPAPMYEITGYVTDFLTGSAVEGAIVATPLGGATTDGTGFYKVTSGSAASGQVEISAAGYQTAKFNLTITEVKTGMSCYTVNAGLKKVGYVDGVVIDQLGTGTEKEVITAGLEALVNESDSEVTKEVTLNFKQGARWNKVITRADKEAFLAYIKALRGISYVGDIFLPLEVTKEIAIPANAYVPSIILYTDFLIESYLMPGDVEANIIDRVLRNYIEPQFVSIDHGHSHDHGHGHGNGNAGGGTTD
jgi:hypothetical protein